MVRILANENLHFGLLPRNQGGWVTASMLQRLRTKGKILEDGGATAILREEEQSGCSADFTAATLEDSGA